MKCYKITINKHSLFVPANASVDYEENTINTAPWWLADQGYHLTTFKSLKNAKNFMRRYHLDKREIELWLCEGYEQVELPQFASLESLSDGKIIYDKDCDWPKGTVMFKKIFLKERIG